MCLLNIQTEYSENTGRDSNIELDNGSPLFHEKKCSTQVIDKNTEQNHWKLSQYSKHFAQHNNLIKSYPIPDKDKES